MAGGRGSMTGTAGILILGIIANILTWASVYLQALSKVVIIIAVLLQRLQTQA